MENRTYRPDDEDGIMSALGPAVPVILTEAVMSGFDDFKRVRDRIPEDFVVYRKTTLANMLVDHIYPHLTDLTALVDPEALTIVARDTDNKRATELWVVDAFYVKIKRVHDKERPARLEEDLAFPEVEEPEIIEFGLPSNVKTRRVFYQQYPPQPKLPGMPSLIRVEERGEGNNRLRLVCAFDLTLGGENIKRIGLGFCNAKEWLWSRSLTELDLATIAQISSPLADRVDELRRVRTA